ncbi:MAG: GNAT family N-acetyltransferase [Oligoflexales bacterium]|nr:GNAT family N-acetyltransferase [Oligoflexales bacterium]
MEIVSFSDILFKQRSSLLQKSLRPHCNSYPIESEYPIVLSAKNPQFSYCVTNKDRKFSTPKLLAHANFWPRRMVEKSTDSEFPVALIGNVATDKNYRGCGLMKSLFTELWSKALDQGFHGLILWSDLLDFYKKLGFYPCGHEYRICFSSKELKKFPQQYDFFVPEADFYNEGILSQMLCLRPKTPLSLKRSTQEFMELLKIPDTVVLVSSHGGTIESYFVLGKGNDMLGVVHEWGAKNTDLVLGALKHIVEATKWDMIWLLAPLCIGRDSLSVFDPFVKSLESHPLALAKFKNKSSIRERIHDCFIWGLDSI